MDVVKDVVLNVLDYQKACYGVHFVNTLYLNLWLMEVGIICY